MVQDYFDSWSYFGEGNTDNLPPAKRAEKLPEKNPRFRQRNGHTISDHNDVSNGYTRPVEDGPRANVVSSVLSEEVWKNFVRRLGLHMVLMHMT